VKYKFELHVTYACTLVRFCKRIILKKERFFFAVFVQLRAAHMKMEINKIATKTNTN
jgi:hypothetical protein